MNNNQNFNTNFENIFNIIPFSIIISNQNLIIEYSNDLYNFFIKKFEKSLINKSLFLVNGNQIKASELLGINRNTLRKKIKQLEIKIIKRVRN